MRSKGFAWVVAVVLLALLALPPAALAKGPPDMVTIEGPGLEEPITITDPETLEAFAFYQFEDMEARMEAPAAPGEGYTITRYIPPVEQESHPWDRVIYYPAEQGGYVFFEGLVDPDMWTQGQGHWYHVSEAGEAAMRRILAEHGALEGGSSAAQAAFGAEGLALVAVGAGLAVALLAVVWRRGG